MTAEEVAKKLKMSRSSIVRWITQHKDELEQCGVITFIWAGKIRQIRVTDFDRFVEFMENKGFKFSNYRKEI